jgi:hypothetical protein
MINHSRDPYLINFELPNAYGQKQATIISFLSSLNGTGKTHFLQQLIQNSELDQILQTKKMRCLVLEISAYGHANMIVVDVATSTRSREVLVDISDKDRLAINLELSAMMVAIQTSNKTFTPLLNSIIRPAAHDIKNIDIASFTLSLLERGDILMGYIIGLLNIVSKMYDLIIVDLPNYFSQYHAGIRDIFSKSHYLLIPYPAQDPNKVKSLFDLNIPYMYFRVNGFPIKLGGLIPIFAARRLDQTASDELKSLCRLFGKDVVWPVIPDSGNHLWRPKKDYFKNTSVGIEPTVERIVRLIGRKPHGLTKDLQKIGKKFINVYDPLQGLQTEHDDFKIDPDKKENKIMLEKTLIDFGLEIGLMKKGM